MQTAKAIGHQRMCQLEIIYCRKVTEPPPALLSLYSESSPTNIPTQPLLIIIISGHELQSNAPLSYREIPAEDDPLPLHMPPKKKRMPIFIRKARLAQTNRSMMALLLKSLDCIPPLDGTLLANPFIVAVFCWSPPLVWLVSSSFSGSSLHTLDGDWRWPRVHVTKGRGGGLRVVRVRFVSELISGD